VHTSEAFTNEDDYKFWSDKDKKKTPTRANQQEQVKERLSKYKDYNDFLKAYENHRDDHDARSKLFREEGFSQFNDKYGHSFNAYQEMPNSKENQANYNEYKQRYAAHYWDTKDNHAYYSQSMSTRAFIAFKKVTHFYSDSFVLWGLLASPFVVFNAWKMSP